jgi:hypothetical protein
VSERDDGDAVVAFDDEVDLVLAAFGAEVAGGGLAGLGANPDVRVARLSKRGHPGPRPTRWAAVGLRHPAGQLLRLSCGGRPAGGRRAASGDQRGSSR